AQRGFLGVLVHRHPPDGLGEYVTPAHYIDSAISWQERLSTGVLALASAGALAAAPARAGERRWLTRSPPRGAGEGCGVTSEPTQKSRRGRVNADGGGFPGRLSRVLDMSHGATPRMITAGEQAAEPVQPADLGFVPS